MLAWSRRLDPSARRMRGMGAMCRRSGAWPRFPAGRRTSFRRPRPQVERPGLAHEVVAEAAVRLRFDEAIAGRLVETPRVREDAVGPQHDAGVAGRACEDPALLDEATADAEAARTGLYVEH